MNIQIIKSDKHELEVLIDNVTIAEILRTYLNENGVELAVWRREHPSKPALLKIKTSGQTIGKAVADAVSAINGDCEKLLAGIKK